MRRGEIGFLKPLMRRAFLDQHGLRYNETLRLGEDYDLYARALANGARYKIIHSCGYAAVVRGNSLSGSHRTIDLKRLYEADRAILAGSRLSSDAEAAVRRHERHIRDRYELRHFLDLKNQQGVGRAFGYALTHPAALPGSSAESLRTRPNVFVRPVRRRPSPSVARATCAICSRLLPWISLKNSPGVCRRVPCGNAPCALPAHCPCSIAAPPGLPATRQRRRRGERSLGGSAQ